MIVERIEVDRHTPRSADLVLAPVALPDRLGHVVVAHEVRLERGEDLAREGLEASVAREREDGDLIGRETWMDPKQRPRLAGHHVLVIGGEEEGHHGPGGSRGRLDDVGHVPLARRLVEVLEAFAGARRVGFEVVVGPVGDALELVPAPGKRELHVRGGRRVVGELVRTVVAQPQLRLGDPEGRVPGEPLGEPVLEPLRRVGRGDEVLHLHLLELAGAEDEVLRGDLVAERLAHLGDPERRSLPGGLDHVGEVDEHPLRGLRTQVGDRTLVLDGAGMGLEHEVERPCLGELGRATRRADPFDLVLPPPLMAVAAVDERVGEVGEVARSGPDRRRRQDRGVEPHHVVTPLDHRLPPGVLDVAQQVDPERSVVVGRAEAAVDLGGLEDEAASLAEADDLFQQVCLRLRHAGEWYRLAPATRPGRRGGSRRRSPPVARAR